MSKVAKQRNVSQILIRVGLGILFGWCLVVLISNPARFLGSMWDEVNLGVIILSSASIGAAALFGSRPKVLIGRIAIGLVAAAAIGFIAYYSIYMLTIVRSFVGF